jgi:hypothetical protein
MDGAQVAGDVGKLVGEEECVGLRLGALREGIGDPIVRVGRDEVGVDEVVVQSEYFCERGARVGCQFVGGLSFQR